MSFLFYFPGTYTGWPARGVTCGEHGADGRVDPTPRRGQMLGDKLGAPSEPSGFHGIVAGQHTWSRHVKQVTYIHSYISVVKSDHSQVTSQSHTYIHSYISIVKSNHSQVKSHTSIRVVKSKGAGKCG